MPGTVCKRAILFLEELEARDCPAVISVNLATDVVNPNDGKVSLREAIALVNQGTGGDVITFDIDNSEQRITLTAANGVLPALTKKVTIDASAPAGKQNQVIILDGGLIQAAGANGLELKGKESIVKKLSITGFRGAGIKITAATPDDPDTMVTVVSCNIYSNGDGILVFKSGKNEIGQPGQGNIIADNQNVGVVIRGEGSTSNKVMANSIRNNKREGVLIGLDATNNIIGKYILGGAIQGEGNTIVSNLGNGIWLTAANNKVAGNYIGIAATGNFTEGVIYGNSENGIKVGGDNNQIGGPEIGLENFISANLKNGILISGRNATVSTNYIGMNLGQQEASDGRGASTGNRLNGVAIEGTADNTKLLFNTIGANARYGIELISAAVAVKNVEIHDNAIGQGKTLQTLAFNGKEGVYVNSATNLKYTRNKILAAASTPENVVRPSILKGLKGMTEIGLNEERNYQPPEEPRQSSLLQTSEGVVLVGNVYGNGLTIENSQNVTLTGNQFGGAVGASTIGLSIDQNSSDITIGGTGVGEANSFVNILNAAISVSSSNVAVSLNTFDSTIPTALRLDSLADVSLSADLAGAVEVNGSHLHITDSATTASLDLNFSSQLRLDPGTTLTVSANQSIDLDSTSTLVADDSIINGTVNNAGLINLVGDLQIVGNLNLLSTSVVTAHLASTQQFGSLAVTGHLAAGGTLALEFDNGYAPVADDLFPLISYGSRSDTFSSVLVPSVSPLYFASQFDDPNSIYLAWFGEIDITPIADQYFYEGDTVSLQVEASVSHGDPIPYYYTASNLPYGLGIDPFTGLISGTLSYGWPGAWTSTVYVSALNGSQAISSTEIDWDITQVEILVAPIADQAYFEGDSVSVQVVAEVSHGDPIPYYYTASNLPYGLGIDPFSGLISGTISYGWPGEWTSTIYVSALNGSQAIGSTGIDWDIAQVEILVAPIVDQAFYEGDTVSIQVVASVSHGNPIPYYYTASNLPYGLSIDPFSGLISGTISYGWPGAWTSTVYVSALNGSQAVGSTEIVWDISPAASVSTFVWDDANGDGIYNSGEAGLAGIAVMLVSLSGGSNFTATTDASGHVVFTNLAAGNYALRYTLPPDTMFTLQDQGSDDAVDSDVDPLTGETDPFVLLAGEFNPFFAAGLLTSNLSA